jgi:hypothetical protein
MEIPYLSSSTVWCFDDHVSVVDKVEVSVVWESRDNVEVSLNVKTESFIELTLSWFSLPLIGVDDVPLLVNGILLSVDTNVSVF